MASEYLNNRVFEGIISKFQKSKKATARYELIIEDWTEAFSRKKNRGNNIPLDNERVQQSEVNYREASDDYFNSKEELAIAFYTLSEHLVRYAKFQLIDDDDAIQEGVMICFEKVDRFDPRKGKAFNYMTTCILNHFRQMYRTARHYNELKKKYLAYLTIVGDQVIVRDRSKSYTSSLHYSS